MTADAILTDLVRDSVVVSDRDGRILSWNAASVEIYGWTAEQAIGRTLADITGQGAPPDVDHAVEARLERGRSDGRSVLVELRWSRRTDGRIVEIGRDVTEQHRTEQALKRSELRYSSLFQAMAAAFWELDFSPVGALLKDLRAQGVDDFPRYFAEHPGFVREMMRQTRVVDVNDTTLEVFGIGDRSRLDRSVEPYWPEASTQVYAAAVLAAISRQGSYMTETRLRRRDGSEFDALFTAAFPHEGLAQGALLVGVIDISQRTAAMTELSRSETRYRNLFHDMPIALWQIDARALTPVLGRLKQQGVDDLGAYMQTHPELLDQALEIVRVEGVNRRTVELFGGESEADFIGPVAKFWRARPETFARSLIARYAGDATYTEETCVPGIDGRQVDIHYTIAFPGALSEIGISIIGCLDIGERLKAQADLKRLQDDFAHAARVSMLGELTASIAHEVNQPLAAISANASASLRWLDRAEPDVSRAVDLTSRIRDDAQRAADVIARVRGMASKAIGERETLSLKTLVEEVLTFLGPELQSRKVEVRNEVAALMINGDRTQLQQVLLNLIMNAVQAAVGAGVSPVLTLSSADDEGFVELRLADNGPGLSEEAARRLFSSFYSTKPDGMGLGLPICRSIIEAHGGEISAANAADGGAVFLIRLPSERDHTKV